MTDAAKARRQPAFVEDPPVIVHPGDAPYAVRIELQVMARDWDALTTIQLHATGLSLHNVISRALRHGIAEGLRDEVRRGVWP